ncbi:MAG: sigma 54-interacting transcriptional regulator [Clostridiales Family XIII bacterium]|nr:sigma 54-interacting transcriptional regulator [Clostridiales Family XIII bacterium]
MPDLFKKDYLQYAFFVSADEEILPCDEGTQAFLDTLDIADIRTHLLSIKFSASVTNSTIILSGTSYNLRLTPLNDTFFTPLPHDFTPEYLVTMQNQAHVSSIIRELQRVQFDPEAFPRIFDDLPNGIFVDDADGNILYLNRKYEELSGMKFEQMVGCKLLDLAREGVLRPTISPTILLNKNEITVLQTIDKKKNTVISGFPVCNNEGAPILILTCLNEISGMDALFSAHDISDANLDVLFTAGAENSTISVIAESGAMRAVLNDSVSIAQYPVPVLILGESGTGKEIIANVIHASSRWRANPFIKINCSAISPTLLESELFGYEGGAFTGAAAKGKPGLFDAAHNGTMLLDEVGDMPMELQARILRVLQSGEFYRVGGTELVRVNVRIIASTNKDLKALTADGLFRTDLYFRLNTITIRIPPLRERKDDIEPLLLHYTYMCNKLYGTNKTLSETLIRFLLNYAWPGNIRELENIVKRLIITCTEEILTMDSFYSKYGEEYVNRAAVHTPEARRTLRDFVETYEKAIIEETLSFSKNTREAAALLGISQATLLRKR